MGLKLYTSKAISLVLDLTERRVRQLRDEGILTEARRGYFELQPTIHAYIQYLRRQAADSNQTSDFNTERAKLAKTKRERQELELSLMKKEAHSSEVVELIVVDMLIRFKNKMLAIPSTCSPQLREMTDAHDINDLLMDKIKEALEELSEFGPALQEYEHEISEMDE